MINWKQTVATAGLFALATVVALAGQARRGEGGPAREGRVARGQMSPELAAKIVKIIEPVVIKQLIDELSIDQAKAKEVFAAYQEAGKKMRKIMEEARQSQDADKRREAFQQMRQINQQMLEGKLDEQQARRARRILGGASQLQTSIAILLQAKVEDAKIEKAVPVLVKYQTERMGLFRRGGGEAPSREERTAKLTELRDRTAKELAPIIGEEAANTWKERAARTGGGRRSGGEGRQGGDRPQRGQRQRPGADAPAGP